jgi:uncharacterized protein
MIKGLFTNEPSLRSQLADWEKTALLKFEEKMTDKKNPFPCIPATIGFSLNHLRYGFAGDPRKECSTRELALLLEDFSRNSRHFGNYTSLIIFFNTPQSMIKTFNVQQYEQLFWQHLNMLNEFDTSKWPEDIPDNPHNPIWEFCFHGEPYFMYCATPAHINRKSRHFDFMMLAITPRWVLKEFNKSESHAARIKLQVRKRLADYDTIEIHKDLNLYGKNDNYEWKQYFLRDDDTSLSKCPFHCFFNFFKKEP